MRLLHRWVVELEPWGVLVAMLALIVASTQFWAEYEDRVNEREVRAWQLVTTAAPGNSGKIAALEYLNKEVGFLCSERLRRLLKWLHGEEHANTRCVVLLKGRTPLVGIDLSAQDSSNSERVVRVFLQSIDLSGAVLTSADVKGADLTGADLTGANLARADLSDAYLTHADLSDAYLTHADLVGADLSGANLSHAYLLHANLLGANLFEANLFKANLFGANLSHADLSHADLSGADVSYAHLSGANLSGANLSGVNLARTRLDTACGNEDTVLPEGRTVPICSE